jgi:hypothetical protein
VAKTKNNENIRAGYTEQIHKCFVRIALYSRVVLKGPVNYIEQKSGFH